MKCHECGGIYTRRNGVLQITDKYVGPFAVELGEYWECDTCADYLFSPEDSKRIEKVREQALQTMLQLRPLSAFYSAGETAAFLEISRQALHKHRRICRGFIFATTFGGKTVFLKKSVKLFKATGDGRYALWEPAKEVQYTQKKEMVSPAVLYLNKAIMFPSQSQVRFGTMYQTEYPRSLNYAK